MMKKEYSTGVIIVGGGPSGLATSACLSRRSIPNVILEKEKCHSSLWRTRAYDTLKVHLAKEFCHLPHMPHKHETPTYIPREEFVQYLDDYVHFFNLKPKFCRKVESSHYDNKTKLWTAAATNTETGELEEYTGKFLVVATGENSEGYIPKFPGIESFQGDTMHSVEFKSAKKFAGERVLVVGCGNSGMEIAYDLCNSGAQTSIVVRSNFHVFTKEMIHRGMVLLKHFPVWMVDTLVLLLAWFKYGNLNKYGIIRPKDGPFLTKMTLGRSPVIDVGTVNKIKRREIQVLPADISNITGNEILFSNGKTLHFNAIIFATGYKSTAKKWFRDDESLLNEEGFPKGRYPNHWKGKNGAYFAGFSRRGIAGITFDAQVIADDIIKQLISTYDDQLREAEERMTQKMLENQQRFFEQQQRINVEFQRSLQESVGICIRDHLDDYENRFKIEDETESKDDQGAYRIEHVMSLPPKSKLKGKSKSKRKY